MDENYFMFWAIWSAVAVSSSDI